MSDEQPQAPSGLMANLPDWLVNKERGHVKKAKDIIMTLRRQGLTKEQISIATGIPAGTLSGALSAWAKESQQRNETQRQAMEQRGPAEPEANDADIEAALAEMAEDDQAGAAPATNAGMASMVDQILRKALPAAARTVAKAAAGGKVDSQVLAGAKLLLKKYGMLQEEYEAKESQYVKMNAVELCERSCAAALAVARSKGNERLVAIMQRAMDEITEAKEERPAEAA